MKNATILLGLLILTAACTTAPETNQPEKITKYFSFGNEAQPQQKIHHIRFLEAKYEATDRNLERFFPDTLTVKQGDKVRISMLTEQANTISINGIGYGMKAGEIDFTPEKGTYTIICEDCIDNPTARLRVI